MNIDLRLPGNTAVSTITGNTHMSDQMMTAMATFALAEETRNVALVALLGEDPDTLRTYGIDKALLAKEVTGRLGLNGN
ncbi:hypothetical protein [Pseudarthrobacter sp. PS3-L1]|uniref:hypothetical protein n=1 Tax=Pseudarthrobacter sp. PS3-L1 TaxID=3046207 RepID=UPI0024B91F17|nr:hypothetical protein [Pseudarthrobacter sp. PS3-L1]MDJ0321846.1 hypothetical protein [Pseudarthrobacter sp. PS3-L1]